MLAIPRKRPPGATHKLPSSKLHSQSPDTATTSSTVLILAPTHSYPTTHGWRARGTRPLLFPGVCFLSPGRVCFLSPGMHTTQPPGQRTLTPVTAKGTVSKSPTQAGLGHLRPLSAKLRCPSHSRPQVSAHSKDRSTGKGREKSRTGVTRSADYPQRTARSEWVSNCAKLAQVHVGGGSGEGPSENNTRLFPCP